MIAVNEPGMNFYTTLTHQTTEPDCHARNIMIWSDTRHRIYDCKFQKSATESYWHWALHHIVNELLALWPQSSSSMTIPWEWQMTTTKKKKSRESEPCDNCDCDILWLWLWLWHIVTTVWLCMNQWRSFDMWSCEHAYRGPGRGPNRGGRSVGFSHSNNVDQKTFSIKFTEERFCHYVFVTFWVPW